MADEGRKISQFPDASSLTDSDLIPIVQSNTNKKITGKKIKTFLQESGEFAPTNSPNFTGSPTAETQSKGDNSNRLATTAFVQQNKTTITQATEENLGGIRAKAKTDETVEAAIDPSTGKIYVPTYPTGGGGEGSVDITDVQVTVDQNTGVPSATGSFEEGILKLDFKNLKGADAKTPDITINATVDDNIGTPSVEVSESGGVENPSFSFAFKNLKGKNGDPGQGVPAGGTTGQVLKKKSGTDYDTEWADETGGSSAAGGLSVSFDEETQNIVFEGNGGGSGGVTKKEWVKEEITVQTGTTLYQLSTVGADEFFIVFDNSLTGIFTSSSKVFGSLIASITALSKGKSLYIKRTNDKFIAFGQRSSDLLAIMSTADVVEEGIELVTGNNNGKIYFYKR